MKTKEKRIKEEKGITLVALVISIIVMIILSGISLNATIGENGIINRARESKLKQEEAEAEGEILSGIASLDIEYYQKATSDTGITINSIYSISGLSKYVNGKINGFNYNKNGTTVVYYTNERGSYTVKIGEDGNVATYSGIFVQKDETISIQMGRNDKITLNTDMKDTIWAVISGNGTVDPNTGEVTKNDNETIIIKGQSDEGEVTIIIEGTDEETDDVLAVIETKKISETVTATIEQRADGICILRISGTGEIPMLMGQQEMQNAGLVKEIIIEDGITYLGALAFNGFRETEKITIPKTVTSYNYSFAGNLSKLNTVNYNAKNASADMYFTDYILENAVFRNSNITNINIGSEVESIPDYFFINCQMSSVIIPNSVKTIGNYAFVNCNKLKYISIGENVEEIRSGAFAYTAIDSITIPENVKTIGLLAFLNCLNLKTINYNAIDCKYEGVFSDGIFSIVPIVEEDNKIIKNSILENINIGNGVQNIPQGMFSNFTNIKSINFSNSLKSIERYAFYSSGLTEVNLNNQLEIIGAEAFAYTSIEKITIPENTKFIFAKAFSNCYSLREINYNAINCTYDAIKGNTIYYLFGAALSLKTVNIGSRVEKIPSGAFGGLQTVENIKLPDNVKEVESYAFFNASGIRNLDLGNGLEKIGNEAFTTLKITELTLPESLKSIGAWAFYGCNDIGTLYYNAIDCSTDEAITSDASYYPFQANDKPDVSDCFNIENIYLGNKVKRLDEDIFRKCNITTITIPSSVEYIASSTDNSSGAFCNCRFLKEIIVKKPENSIEGAPWSNVSGINVRWEP